jgi:hypothetical protein
VCGIIPDWYDFHSSFSAVDIEMCMGLFQTGMLHIPRNETNTRDGCKRLPFSFLAGIFKSKKSQDDQSNIEFEDPSSLVDMDRSSDHHSK